jgi:hypothetical protein
MEIDGGYQRWYNNIAGPWLKVCKKTLDPEWNETFEFVGVKDSSPLVVECYDRDYGYVANTKDLLGVFQVGPSRPANICIASSSACATHVQVQRMCKACPTHVQRMSDASATHMQPLRPERYGIP